MVKQIIHDTMILARKSQQASAEDITTAQDLIDTLTANRERCVGMAANMIGVSKRIIVFDDHGEYKVMLNPEIIRKSGEYTAEEGCLSLEGVRKTARFRKIKVRYQNMSFQKREQSFEGWTAQIIQHEIDHCDGILI